MSLTLERSGYKPDLSLYGKSSRKKEREMESLNKQTISEHKTLRFSEDETNEKNKKPETIMEKLSNLVKNLEEELDFNLNVVFNEPPTTMGGFAPRHTNNNIKDFHKRLQKSPLIIQFDPNKPETLQQVSEFTNIPSGVVHQFFDNAVDRSAAESHGLTTVAFWAEPESPEEIQTLKMDGNKSQTDSSLKSIFPGATIASSQKPKKDEKPKVSLNQMNNRKIDNKPVTHVNPKLAQLMTPGKSLHVSWVGHQNQIDVEQFLKEKMDSEAHNRGIIKGHKNYLSFLNEIGLAPDANNEAADFYNAKRMAI